MRRIAGFCLAAAAVTAVVTAQSPAQIGPAPSGDTRLQPAYEQQLVTVEGCLHRERAPEEVAREVAEDPERGIFVLVDVDVRSRIDTKPGAEGADADPRVLGPAGIQNERVGLPGDGVPEAAPGDPDHEPASPAVEGSPTPAADRYLIDGLPEARLRPFAGQRVAMTGQFEPPIAAVEPGVAADEAVGTTGTSRWPGNLPRFRATSVKPVPGICVPKP